MTNDHFCSLDFHLINSFSCNNFNLSAHFTVTSRTPGETNQSCCGIIIRQVKIQNYIKLPLELASYFDASVACEQALPFGRAKRASRERASEGPFLCPSRLRRSLARSRETRFTRPNRRACSQANASVTPVHVLLLSLNH